MECQLPLDLPQKLNCPCCESFPANAFHSRVSQKAQSGEFKYRGGSSLPWNLLNAIKRGLGHRNPWGCFSSGFSNSWIGQSTRVGLKFPPKSQFPYCLELVLLVRASSFKYKEQYINHTLFVSLVLTNVLPKWQDIYIKWAHRKQMSLPGIYLLLSLFSVPKENMPIRKQKLRETAKGLHQQNLKP